MRDWKVNGRKIKDWRAAFRLWESRESDMKISLGSAQDKEYAYMKKEYSQEELNRVDDPEDALVELLGCHAGGEPIG